MSLKRKFVLFAVLLGLAGPAYAVGTKLSQINNGGAVVTSTDQMVAVRSGTTDELVSLAASAGTDTTNASNISSGTLAAVRGGAGTISGALKGNGAGVVSQAACADLSNGAASCSTDTTNASNISSGTLPAARLPAPTASTLGGIQALASSANIFITGLSTSGVLTSAQPAFSNLSGSLASTQLPALTGDVTMSAGSNVTTVAKINGNTLGSTTPTSGNPLIGNGSSWVSQTVSGDATLASTGALTLATVNSNVGTFGSSTAVPTITADAKGRITALSSSAVVAPAGTLTGSTLAAGVTGSSLTSVGTIGTGVWNGTVVGAIYGGTNQTSWTTGDLLYASGTNTLAKLAIGSSSQVLTVSAGLPAWAAAGGGSSSGGGTFNYSDNGLTLTAGTYYTPPGGGGIATSTEANVSIKSPSAATVTNLQVSLSAAPGVGQTLAVTLRLNGADTALTCTISGAATSAQDLTHSVNIAQNDVIDWKVVTTGTYVATPTVNISANNGTSGVGVTSVATGGGLTGGTITSSGTISAKSYVLAQSTAQASHTGDTNETALVTYTLPANTLPATGILRITVFWSRTGTNNTNTVRIRFNGISGTIYASNTMAANNISQIQGLTYIYANNSTSLQKGIGTASSTTPYSLSTTAMVTSSINTTSNVDIVFSGQLSNSSDSTAIEAYTIEMLTP